MPLVPFRSEVDSIECGVLVLVVKRALVQAHSSRDFNHVVIKHTKAILFLGTLHRGTSFGPWGWLAAKALQPLGSNPFLLADLEYDSLALHDLHRDFIAVAQDDLRVFNFFEERPTRILQLGFIRWQQFCVREQSAAYNGRNVRNVGLSVDHYGLNKFGSRCESYRAILSKLIEEDQQFLERLYLTDPRADKLRIKRTKGGLLQESYRWVSSNPNFQQWRKDPESRLLWGKTMLLYSIIDELSKSTDSILSFFFCQATDSRINNATAVLRSLIYLVVVHQPSLLRHVRSEYNHAGETLFKDVNTWDTLSKIFTSILGDPGLKMTYLVIDALDECLADRVQLLKFITEKSAISSRVKWVVSSRNWQQIEERLKGATPKEVLSLELNAESVATAVNAYIRHKVDKLARLKNYDTRIQDAVQNYLSLQANGTFL
ncbi:hypothetical protein OQA88_11797 [Cercophora sp. LCS_1]